MINLLTYIAITEIKNIYKQLHTDIIYVCLNMEKHTVWSLNTWSIHYADCRD